MGKYAQFINAQRGSGFCSVNSAGLPEAECLMAFEEMKQAILKEGTGSSCTR